jgi:hypothetical protein
VLIVLHVLTPAYRVLASLQYSLLWLCCWKLELLTIASVCTRTCECRQQLLQVAINQLQVSTATAVVAEGPAKSDAKATAYVRVHGAVVAVPFNSMLAGGCEVGTAFMHRQQIAICIDMPSAVAVHERLTHHARLCLPPPAA